MFRISIFIGLSLHVASTSVLSAGYDLPEKVKVLPIVFLPSDQEPPTTYDQRLFTRHLTWANRRYEELLDGVTFEFAERKPTIVKGQRPLEFYRSRPENAAPEIVVELLEHFELTRFNNPYVFAILVANHSEHRYPIGGGRPINGGLNSGGGMFFIGSSELTKNSHFQTTVQHELGHSFGLAHPNVYGYDQKTNDSMMSYNPKHFTNGLTPSRTPGRFIPEDVRALAMNDRVFNILAFDVEKDVPQSYQLSPKVVPLGPMNLPGRPDFYPEVSTDSGEDVRSKVVNVVQGQIKPSAGPGITYDARNMWHSNRTPREFATLEFKFPFSVTIDGLAIHSQHSGKDHEVTAMKLERIQEGTFIVVHEQNISDVDATIKFDETTAQRWKLTLKTGTSGILVIRGIRFLYDGDEIFPRMVPTDFNYIHFSNRRLGAVERNPT